ncbi:MAG: hypothetical protein ABFQ95_00440 [Pseudomonadota bacterium]
MTISEQKKRGRRRTSTGHLCENWHSRLKMARRISGLSKKYLQDKYHLNAHTLASLEISRSILSEEWGKQFCRALQEEKVLCSPEWLFKGTGTPPKRLQDREAALLLEQKRVEDCKVFNDEVAITSEVKTFCAGHKDNMVAIVKDDAMSPFFEFGDYVGCRRVPLGSIDQMLGEKCLIEPEPGEYLVRHFTYDDNTSQYLLSAANPKSTINRPLLFIKKPVSVSQIIWIRRLPRPILD